MPSSHITRRRLAQGAAWSAPMILAAGAVPAHAVSICDEVSYAPALNSNTVTRASDSSATGAFNPVTPVNSPTGPVKPTVAVTFKATALGGKTLNSAQNLTVAGQQLDLGYNGAGDLATNGLELIQSGPIGYAARQTLTITFDRPVKNLAFTIADLDRAGYLDQVALSGSPTVSNGSNVSGAGTTTSPLGPATNVGDRKSDDVTTRSDIRYSQPVTSVTIDFWSKQGTLSQQVFISGMSFTASTCP